MLTDIRRSIHKTIFDNNPLVTRETQLATARKEIAKLNKRLKKGDLSASEREELEKELKHWQDREIEMGG